ncbi:MAG: MATE family efflux transporter [Proteobacteria bacterium]|nr:MATE family efflux transporter [Pseudomonadota bacterium]
MRAYLDRSFFQKLFRLAIPVSLQYLLHSSRYIADMFMLGQIGENPLAAVGLCTNLHMLFNSVVWGLAAGVGILGAQFFGAKQTKRLAQTVNIGVAASALLMLPLCLLLFVWPEGVMRIGTDQGEIIALGARYLRITALLPLGMTIVASVGAGLNAMGRPHVNFIFTTVAVFSNIFLNWVLIFGNLGAPALGVDGAALATLLSMLIEVAFIFAYLAVAKTAIRVTPLRVWRALDSQAVRHFLRISVPLTIGGVAWHVGAFVYQAIYGHMGTLELASVSMVQPMRTIMFAFFWGISTATGVIMGHHLGAGEFQHAWYRSQVLVAFGVGASLIAVLLVWLGEPLIFSLYGQMTAETLEAARLVLWAMLLTTPILAANVVGVVGILQSGADTRFVLFMDVSCQWLVGIPFCYLAAFSWHWPIAWVYLAAFGEEFVKLFIWAWRFRSRAWIRRLVHDVAA